MLRSEFECDIEDWPGADVIRCKQLGKQQNNKTQPLLATLGSRDQATYFIKNARYLRSSNIKAVREGVYINADLTPPEAKAAYELRLKRKQRQQREQNKGGQQSDQATTESTRRVRLVYRSTAATTTTILHPSDQPYPHDDLSSLTNDCGSRESTTTALNQVRLEASSSEASMEAKNDQMSNAEAQHISLQWRSNRKSSTEQQAISESVSAATESQSKSAATASFQYNTLAPEFCPVSMDSQSTDSVAINAAPSSGQQHTGVSEEAGRPNIASQQSA